MTRAVFDAEGAALTLVRGGGLHRRAPAALEDLRGVPEVGHVVVLLPDAPDAGEPSREAALQERLHRALPPGVSATYTGHLIAVAAHATADTKTDAKASGAANGTAGGAAGAETHGAVGGAANGAAGGAGGTETRGAVGGAAGGAGGAEMRGAAGGAVGAGTGGTAGGTASGAVDGTAGGAVGVETGGVAGGVGGVEARGAVGGAVSGVDVVGGGMRAGLRLVVDAGYGALRAGVVEIGPAGPVSVAAVTLSELGGHAYLAAVAAKLPVQAREALPEAVAAGGLRLAATLAHPGLRDTPAVTAAGVPVSTGVLLDAFAPYAERVRAAIARLVPAGVAEVLLTGDFAGFPPLPSLVEDAAGAPLRVLAPDAAARGALLIADGRVTEPAVHARPIELRVHRIAGGRLEVRAVPLPAGPGRFAVLDGEPLHVTTGASLDLTGARPVVVPAGSYELGVRVLRHGAHVLALRAPGGPDPLFVPLEPPP